MKNVLMLASLVELSTGLVLLVDPAVVVRLLFNAEIANVGVILSRIAAIALIALGTACWQGKSAFQPLNGMLAYSTLAMLYLTYIGIRGEFAGLFLWPAVAIHLILNVLLARARFNHVKSQKP